MIRIGDMLPDVDVRTDEGTPLSLTDLNGRATAVFLCGPKLSGSVEQLLAVLSENTGRFLSLNMSPVVVLGESTETLSAFREKKDVPFLLLSDGDLSLHREFRGKDGDDVGVWIADPDGTVVEVLPLLPPVEQVRLAVERASRTHRLSSAFENNPTS